MLSYVPIEIMQFLQLSFQLKFVYQLVYSKRSLTLKPLNAWNFNVLNKLLYLAVITVIFQEMDMKMDSYNINLNYIYIQ